MALLLLGRCNRPSAFHRWNNFTDIYIVLFMFSKTVRGSPSPIRKTEAASPIVNNGSRDKKQKDAQSLRVNHRSADETAVVPSDVDAAPTEPPRTHLNSNLCVVSATSAALHR